MEQPLFTVLNLILTSYVLGLLSAQWFNEWKENRHRKRFKAEDEKRKREADVIARLYKIELQQSSLDSRLDRIERSNQKTW